MAPEIECAVRCRDLLGECPLWDERDAVLWWVDILGPSLKSFSPTRGKLEAFPMQESVGSFAFRESGGLVAAMKSGLYFLDPRSGERQALAQPERDRPDNRFNDGRCDRRGRFWAGTMNESKREPDGALYRLSIDGRCERKRSGVIIPNSLAWSPDGRTMYFADTVRDLIWAFDYDPDSGEMANERVFADCAPNAGYPDGSCVDAEGCLWNAEYGGARIVRYTPGGKIDRTIELPVRNPTCCCFGGARLDTLYIATASQQMKPEQLEAQPLAGSVLAVRPGVVGLAESRFGG